MSKHTPGPWEFIDATKVAGMKFSPKCVIKAGQKQIADFSWNDKSPWFPTKDESQANARLIAAAPDLLKALKDMLSEFDTDEFGSEGQMRTCAKAEAVIAKAEGRS